MRIFGNTACTSWELAEIQTNPAATGKFIVEELPEPDPVGWYYDPETGALTPPPEDPGP